MTGAPNGGRAVQEMTTPTITMCHPPLTSTGDTVEYVVERVLAVVRSRLGQQYTLDDLAKMAMFSKFHFARMFRRVTGLPPRRFLYALRLQEAKRLLVTTSMSVADISHEVGYASVGTFTSRFTSSIGVSPAHYRRLGGRVWSAVGEDPPDPTASGVVAGRVELAEGVADAVPAVVCLFRDPLPEGRPVRCEAVKAPGEWVFRHLPSGRWYVLAVSYPPGPEPLLSVDQRFLLGMSGPVGLAPESPPVQVTVRLRPSRPVDPPILVPLAGLPPRECAPDPVAERHAPRRLGSARAQTRRVHTSTG